MEEIAESIVRPIAESLEHTSENLRAVSKVVERLSTVVGGDRDFQQDGLVDTVKQHGVDIQALKTLKSEITGAVRAWGLLFTLVNLGIAIWSLYQTHLHDKFSHAP